MEISGSSAPASPPWQLAQVSPFCAWISWLNFSSVTPRLSVRMEWQSRQVFLVWARAAPANTSAAAMAMSHRQADEVAMLVCIVAINGHPYDVSEGQNRQRIDPFLATLAIDKRQQQPDCSSHAESQHAQDLAIDEQNFGGNEFECLEHEQEIPLRLDSGRSGDKWIGLYAQVPRKDRRQRAQRAQRHIPGHQFAQGKIGKEFHLAQSGGLALPFRFHLGRNADAKSLHQQNVQPNQHGR